MFHCDRIETKNIMSGQADGVVRMYGGGCPHKVGNEIVLTSKTLDSSGRSIPFARATITSIRPGTVGEFSRDPMIAEMDGFENPAVWLGHLRVVYPGIREGEQVTHIRFRLVEMDREAGLRGDVQDQEMDPSRIVD